MDTTKPIGEKKARIIFYGVLAGILLFLGIVFWISMSGDDQPKESNVVIATDNGTYRTT